ncbi:ISL3 family transposase [Luteococcus japonicus]|uniref:Mobile element protein n=1 Tax=Luteococcus japonicus LSP_Lj1 TaxID=1255658 RepID=A0A1R4IDJ4_9ACTN|nr:ISL3 family transposase [Luteococcus japonicus]SJN17353.1 Mobile element protein [Luteococcus japonicus LSP_Lj1]
MSQCSYTTPDVTTFCRLDDLGLVVVGQHLTAERAGLLCRPVSPDDWCHRCGCHGQPRDSVTRELAHVPFGWRPTTLQVRLRRYQCTGCGHIWRQDLSNATHPRSSLSKGALRWALEALVVNHLSVSRIAAALDVAWNTANTAVLAEGQRLLIDKPGRLDTVTVVGVDEHVWRHTRRGDKYVTVVIDLTPVSTGTGPSRLLAMVEGRSKQAFKTWLSQQPQDWRDGIRIVAMDGFTGFKTAAAEELPKAATVMDPFHVIRLAGDALDICRRRVQVELHGSRGRKHHPLYQNRRTLHTGADLLTDKQQQRLDALFADDRHVEVEATWGVYQRMISAYRATSRKEGKKVMTRLIEAIGTTVPTSLVEVAKLGRTLTKRREDVLAFFDHHRSSNGPTEAINGLIELHRRIARGFRNRDNYRLRCLLIAGGLDT